VRTDPTVSIQSLPAGDRAYDVLAPWNEFDPRHYQCEHYLGEPGRNPALTLYYRVKPLIPRGMQLTLRRAYARRQAQRAFPAWPIEPILVDQLHEGVRAALIEARADRLPFVGLWPRPWRAACVLTHDVEGAAGIDNIERVLEVEQRHGLRSAWNFVAEDYRIPPGTFEKLRDAGCEIGLHGINHDGKLFQTRSRFLDDLPKIHAYLESWGAVGFRSPATHRRADWMHELGCLYDSSYPDTDPFEPQPGGCCSILPFLFGDVVELPMTLVQDHTLWEVLRQHSIELWVRKSDWIIANHGLVNLNTHPDYLNSSERLRQYEDFLIYLAGQRDCWHALPREVAGWWRARTPMPPADVQAGEGLGHGASVWWASDTGFEL
jgi:peptidoglycan/xylan/chitin deacetylase (PgdA/CDA1 family)